MTAKAAPEMSDESIFDAFEKRKKGIHPDMPKLIPVNGTAIVQEIIEEDPVQARAEAAGIIVPDEARKELQASSRGILIAISSGFQNALTVQGIPIKEGDILWFGKYSGVAKMLNGRRLRTLYSTDITDVEKPDDWKHEAH
jgi:co-chaperonin GroES (HSP10)